MGKSTAMNYLLAIDAGTTTIKGILFNEAGSSVAKGVSEYNLEMPKPNFVELNSEIYWEATKKVIKQILKKSKINAKKIKALSISSQGETLICLDKDGNSLRKAIVWLDNRSQKEVKIVEKEIGREKIFQISGQPEIPVGCWPARILWLKKNEPALLRKTYKYLLVGEYLSYKFSNKFIGNISLRASTCLYDQVKKCWDEDILKFCRLSPENFPEIKESGTIIGNISKEAAKETGLSQETLIINGALDQHCGAIGAGNIKDGVITESTGGALAIVATIKEPILDKKHRIPTWHHAIPNTYSFLPWGNTAGICLKWFRDSFCSNDSYNLLTREASKILPGSEGLIFLPFLAGGAACPEFDSGVKGLFYAISLNHTKRHFIRAILEAVAFMLKKNLEVMKKLDLRIKEIRSIGGGAKSKLWCQIKADVLQKSVITLRESESACLGAAILAGVGSKIFKNFEEAVKKTVKIKEKILPNLENFEIYEKNYQKYLSIYQKLK